MAVIPNNSRNIRIGRLRAFPIDSIGDNSEQRVQEALHGGKIILPPFVLRRVYRTDQTIMIFKLINDLLEKCVFCGVISFDGEDNKVSVPFWVLKQLGIESGEIVSVELVTKQIEKGQFAQFEALTKSFLQISDSKTALEQCLRNYICLTQGDVISIYVNHRVYELRVCETSPSETIVINECNLSYDFKPEAETIELPEECDLDRIQSQINKSSFEAFSGSGQTSDGTTVSEQTNKPNYSEMEENESQPQKKVGIPDREYKVGTILFKRYRRDLMPSDNSETNQQNLEIRDNNQKKDNEEQRSGSAPRRPVTRSQTQVLRDEANRGATQTEKTNNPSDKKKRKKNNENEN